MTNRILRSALLAAALVVWVALILMWTGRWRPFLQESPAEPDIEAEIQRDVRGDDLDEDGIRDDVGQWVLDRFADDSRRQQAFLQLAADYQTVLITTGSLETSLGSLISLSQSLGCVRYVAGTDAEPLITQFKAVVLDRDVRVRAWLKAYDRWQDSGMGDVSAPSASSCRSPREARTQVTRTRNGSVASRD
jgi:hypothetical protein